MKQVIIIILTVLIGSTSFAQDKEYSTESKSAIRHFEKALKYARERQRERAIEELRVAIADDSKFLEAYVLSAEIYKYERNQDKYKENLERVVQIDPEFEPMYFYVLARLEYRSGNYHKAQEHLLNMKEYVPEEKLENDKAVQHLQNCVDFSMKAIENPVPFEPVNLGQNVNTPNDDYWPSLTADEMTLVTTVLIPRMGEMAYGGGNYHEDLFYSRKNAAGEWQRLRNMGPTLNSPRNEGAQCIKTDGSLCIFTACNRNDGKGSCDLYVSFNEAGSWSKPYNLGGSINTGHWESNPSLSADGKYLYFASNRPGGKGRMDIWRSEISDDMSLKEPENLGDVINTDKDDCSPFIHPDGKSLYFASEGHIGMGNYDLYVTRMQEDGSWSEPHNLGYPINTHQEERSLIVNAKGDKAMFASERDSGVGGLDIYQFDLYDEAQPTRVTYVKGRVYDAKTGENLKADCKLIELFSGETAALETSDAKTGEYLVCLPVNHNYAFNVSKKGYLFYSENFSLRNLENPEEAYKMNIPLQPIEKGKSVILKNIFFEFDRSNLKPESKVELQKLIAFMNENPGLSIELGGHTDNVGNAEYNDALSINRAKTVYDYLIEHGIAKERMSYKGYGFSKPVAGNDTDEGRARNRRTEFKIIKVAQ